MFNQTNSDIVLPLPPPATLRNRREPQSNQIGGNDRKERRKRGRIKREEWEKRRRFGGSFGASRGLLPSGVFRWSFRCALGALSVRIASFISAVMVSSLCHRRFIVRRGFSAGLPLFSTGRGSERFQCRCLKPSRFPLAASERFQCRCSPAPLSVFSWAFFYIDSLIH